MKKYLLSFLMIMMWSPCVSAQDFWQLAPGRSSVSFKVKHLLLFSVDGKFKRVMGRVITPNNDFKNAHAEVAIEANSIYTGNNDRDEHLRNEEFFYADKFPIICFSTTTMEKIDEKNYKMHGNITIRGITKPITMDTFFKGQKTLANGKECLEFTATGVLNRFDFDLRWNELVDSGKALVGDTVEVKLKVALIEEDLAN